MMISNFDMALLQVKDINVIFYIMYQKMTKGHNGLILKMTLAMWVHF